MVMFFGGCCRGNNPWRWSAQRYQPDIVGLVEVLFHISMVVEIEVTYAAELNLQPLAGISYLPQLLDQDCPQEPC